MDFSDHPPKKRAEAFLLVRSQAALLAIPVNSIAPPEQQGQQASLDLAQVCALSSEARVRAHSITLQSAAGPVSLGIDAAEELVHVEDLIALPALTLLQTGGLVRGLLPNPRGKPDFAIALDGVQLGELIARQITDALQPMHATGLDPEHGDHDEL